jgi:FkbM family methyltransferase
MKSAAKCQILTSKHRSWGFRFLATKTSRAIRALLQLRKKRTWGPFVETSEATGFDYAFAVSWSQGGEDLALLSAMQDISKGRYLDIGAHDPSRFSVTRHLYQRGWSGVNVDANPDLIENFNRMRSRDKNLWSAVGSKSEYQFTVFEEPAISTVNDEWREKFLNENQIIKEVLTVPGISLRIILEDNFKNERLDLLSIDAEGADLDVLESLELQSLPKDLFPRFLLLEASPPVSNALKTPAISHAISFGYEPYMVLSMSTLLKAP